MRRRGLRLSTKHDYNADREELLYQYQQDKEKINQNTNDISNNNNLSTAEKVNQLKYEKQRLLWLQSEYQNAYNELNEAEKEHAYQYGSDYLEYSENDNSYSAVSEQFNYSSQNSCANEYLGNIQSENAQSKSDAKSESIDSQYLGSNNNSNDHGY